MTIETVEQIVALLAEYPVSEIALEQDGQRLCVRKPLLTAASAPPPPVPEDDAGDARPRPRRPRPWTPRQRARCC